MSKEITRDSGTNDISFCSFCGRGSDAVDAMIEGTGYGGVRICNLCVEDARVAVVNFKEQRNGKKDDKWQHLTPSSIYRELSKYVVGQDHAKRIVSCAAYEHLKRVSSTTLSGDVEIKKSNILLVGPTGTGKTLIVERLAKILGVPFATADATSLTQAGYVGENVEAVLSRLLNKCEGNVELAKKGIVFIDEIDKSAKKPESNITGRDVGGEGVQQALLKLLEGSEVQVPTQLGMAHPGAANVLMSTDQILFILGGAFIGLSDIVAKRLNKGSTIGFNSCGGGVSKKKTGFREYEMLRKMQPEDLHRFGLIPELVGRIPVHVALHTLNRDDMYRILEEPKDAILKQVQTLMSLEGVSIEVSEEAKMVICDEAVTRSCGARDLRAVVEQVFAEIKYAAPDHRSLHKKYIITGDYAKAQLSRFKAEDMALSGNFDEYRKNEQERSSAPPLPLAAVSGV